MMSGRGEEVKEGRGEWVDRWTGTGGRGRNERRRNEGEGNVTKKNIRRCKQQRDLKMMGSSTRIVVRGRLKWR